MYTSRTTGRVMEVIVEKVSKVKKEVTIIFLEDRATWKTLPFSMILSRSSPLAPLRNSSSSARATAVSAAKVETPRQPLRPEPAREVTLQQVRPLEPPRPEPLVGRINNKLIPDSSITASSYFMNNPRCGLGQMWRTRIDNMDSAWRARADDAAQCVKWDLGSVKRVTKVQTKGCFVGKHWVKRFELSYSLDGTSWTRLSSSFEGNEDEDTLAESDIEPPLSARLLRLHPTAWHEHVGLRAEFFGLDAEDEADEAAAATPPDSPAIVEGPRRQEDVEDGDDVVEAVVEGPRRQDEVEDGGEVVGATVEGPKREDRARKDEELAGAEGRSTGARSRSPRPGTERSQSPKRP